MKRVFSTVFVLLLVVALATPVFATNKDTEVSVTSVQLPVSEDVPADVIEYLEERIGKGFMGKMRAFQPDIPSGEFTYGGGYERLLFDPLGETITLSEDLNDIDSILDIRYDVEELGLGDIYTFIGYIDGEPEFVFEVRKNGDEYNTGTSALSASAARAFERAGFALLQCEGDRYVSGLGGTECMVYVIDGETELMTICSDPLSEVTEDAIFADNPNAAPVVFEAYDYARYFVAKWREHQAHLEEICREEGLPEDTIFIGASPDRSGFVPTHVVDLDEYERMKDARELRAVLLPAGAIAICGAGVAALVIYYRRTRKTDAN